MHDPVQAFKVAILAALGHAPDVIEPGRLQRFATSDKRGDSAGWCKLFADLRGGVYGCNRAGVSETWQANRDQPMTRQQRAELAKHVAEAAAEREAEQRQQWAENAGRIARLWAQCVPLVAGDPVTLYLKRRGFAGVWPLPACLRLHRALPCWDGDKKIGTHPAMVAPLVAPDGRIVALHRTYLTADGRKADVPTVKKLTATAGPLAGACIPLHEPQRGVIGIAEGIETALAAWLASGLPTVAAYSAGNLAAWQWPGSVQRLAIFADNDRAGRESADALRARAFSAGIGCEVVTPSDDGTDWCDVWAQRGAVTIEGAAV
ncbi:toprim domain-containing protein [Roseateles sp. DJS-2-20]|uniref:Toprim domain-containing protein n=1 Tax=Roseateles paludis TaxID=3145238 RepID=A0ABV0G1P4_9BURK